jgi:hypothetical protein
MRLEHMLQMQETENQNKREEMMAALRSLQAAIQTHQAALLHAIGDSEDPASC